jgi:4-carboxymuconolactone decarboxylase
MGARRGIVRLQNKRIREDIMKACLAALVIGAAVASPFTAAAQDTTRFPPLRPDQLTPEQKAWADSIAKPPRNAQFTNPPYRAFARNPVLAEKLQAISDYVRWNSSLPARLSEFAILVTARQWGQQYEFSAHYPLAMKGGLDPKVAADLAAGRRPAGMKDDEAALYDLAIAFYRDKNVSDAVYDTALAKLGEHGMMDAIAVMGYYDLVSMTLTTIRAVPRENGSPLLAPMGQ